MPRRAHSQDLRFALTPLLPDVFANLARSHGLVDRINFKAKPAAGRPTPPPAVVENNSVIANVYPHYLGTVVASHKNVRQGLATVLTYLLAELEPIVRNLHDHIMETHYECYANRDPQLSFTHTDVPVDLDKVRAFIKSKDLYIIEHTLGFFDGPNGKVQTHGILLGSGHRQLLIGFGTGTSKPGAEKAAFSDAIAHGREMHVVDPTDLRSSGVPRMSIWGAGLSPMLPILSSPRALACDTSARLESRHSWPARSWR